MKFLPRKEEEALESIFSRLEAWVVRNDERICHLPCPTPAREALDAAHTALHSAVENVVPGERRWLKKPKE